MGGSSGLNLLAWNRASKPEYDAWETLSGSASWSWAGLSAYFPRSQTIEQHQANPFPGVNPAQMAESFTHGSATGPINVRNASCVGGCLAHARAAAPPLRFRTTTCTPTSSRRMCKHSTTSGLRAISFLPRDI